MHRSRGPATGILLIVLPLCVHASCENTPRGAEPAIQIEFGRRELFQEASAIAIYFYDSTVACDEIRSTTPRPASVLGPYLAILSEAQRTRGISFERSDVPAGEYTLFVDAIDQVGRLVGSGCAPMQKVFDREISRVRIVVS